MEFKLRTNAKFITNEGLLEDLRKTASIVNKLTVSYRDYQKHGTYSTKVYRNRFGTWNKALELAGLAVGRGYILTDKQLLDNLEILWRKLGRQPFYSEMKTPFSLFTPKPYTTRWGSWRKACEALVLSKEGDIEFVREAKATSVARSRTISEKLRLQVLKRDNYKCVKCGRSPATHMGIFLHVDHIKPFSKGGSNLLDNLQTLCQKCNLGKNNDETV